MVVAAGDEAAVQDQSDIGDIADVAGQVDLGLHLLEALLGDLVAVLAREQVRDDVRRRGFHGSRGEAPGVDLDDGAVLGRAEDAEAALRRLAAGGEEVLDLAEQRLDLLDLGRRQELDPGRGLFQEVGRGVAESGELRIGEAPRELGPGAGEQRQDLRLRIEVPLLGQGLHPRLETDRDPPHLALEQLPEQGQVLLAQEG